MIILLFIESRLNFKNIPLNSTFKSSINYEYIVYRNENPISCFLEFLVSLMFMACPIFCKVISFLHIVTLLVIRILIYALFPEATSLHKICYYCQINSSVLNLNILRILKMMQFQGKENMIPSMVSLYILFLNFISLYLLLLYSIS